ncbi:SipW-dependent-type signal peptide-containing protein [Paeniglutamicibacter sp. ABSL32-1]|uniref:SipW-dependent-type signal peptide-containing protein n=1 Tax=Paeniglutamicibacter quisquiliarum TaxID=2849498 RepID=UPI001C2D6338|nr:SipW-dependent-type signal peptide-containing protein [Paeniglutamicibacter quisquiliarum]MBV1777831.1 SipW-dependent-type signal peptide-containing protein [Paeniglutamicibacter quisquiliarum]
MRHTKTTVSRRRFTRLRAVLAGGLVLGIGTTATLAAWTDEEHASGSFQAGTFSIVGSTNGTEFSDHPTAPGAPLVFSVTPDAMVPGTTVFALYSVKTANSSVAGSVQLAADPGNGTGLGEYLRYGVSGVPGTTCNAATFAAGTSVVSAGTGLTSGSAAKIALGAKGSSTVNYCFAVTLPTTAPNAAQGTVLTGRWAFAATAE